ncbi:hypothetical protein Lfu02_03850 [Longispora fulva]|uniref:Uncharacterized protein n=1 Tax=Longispora fulva TaxID=619741 RepID=A0A8J7KP00_9ACTN|nr:hypothetical protein [Longispora fulva]MBG6135747.1 hypothetical protein [Longispora fulva]GIG56013.1 hypothetical protein Lfu02_03850 [Longispora fulva]
MITKFWEGVGGTLAERWAAVSLPALVFWLGGLLAWCARRGDLRAPRAATDWLGGQPALTQAGCVAVALLAVAASGLVVRRGTRTALVLMEGYWPAPFAPLRRRLLARVDRAATADRGRFQELAGPVQSGKATPDECEEYAALDGRLRRLPSRGRYLPTRLGNIIRAAETRPGDKYGLDAVVVWPHLWFLLPEHARAEVAAARRALDSAVGVLVWGSLFTLFTPVSPWAAPVGLGVALLAGLVWAPTHARTYAELVEAAFDLYRGSLYTQLRWPLPGDPGAERAEGELLTRYLLRGSDAAHPRFTGPRD